MALNYTSTLIKSNIKEDVNTVLRRRLKNGRYSAGIRTHNLPQDGQRSKSHRRHRQAERVHVGFQNHVRFLTEQSLAYDR